jgi:hypothetical protein
MFESCSWAISPVAIAGFLRAGSQIAPGPLLNIDESSKATHNISQFHGFMPYFPGSIRNLYRCIGRSSGVMIRKAKRPPKGRPLVFFRASTGQRE